MDYYELFSVLFIRLTYNNKRVSRKTGLYGHRTDSVRTSCTSFSHGWLSQVTLYYLLVGGGVKIQESRKVSNKRIMKWSPCHFAPHVSTRWARTTRPTSMQISSVQTRQIFQADEWANLFPSRLSVIEAAYLYSGDARRDRPAVRTAAIFDCTTWTSPPDDQTWGDPSQGCTCKANGNVGLGMIYDLRLYFGTGSNVLGGITWIRNRFTANWSKQKIVGKVD